MGSLKQKTWVIRLLHREYWPGWIYYIPVWIQHFWLSARVKNVFFFLATNPAIEGFILSDSKYRTMQLIPDRYRPGSILLLPGMSVEGVLKVMDELHITFPVIVKPDIGFRGIKVRKVAHGAELALVLNNQKIPFLLQEYCSHPLELGIFYYRYPGSPKGCIPSITIKEFLTVEGTGSHTLEELVSRNPRALLQAGTVRERFPDRWDQILPEGKVLELEPIGNHNRGTRFIDGSHKADAVLRAVFDTLSHEMEGFYFGRFDIRTPSWEALKERREFAVLEMNGVGGEPTHIYDPAHSLFKAWKDLCSSWRVAAKIAEKNIGNGTMRPTYTKARTLWRSYVAYKSDLLG